MILTALKAAWGWFSGTKIGKYVIMAVAFIGAIFLVYLAGRRSGSQSVRLDVAKEQIELKKKMENADVSNSEEEVLDDLDSGRF